MNKYTGRVVGLALHTYVRRKHAPLKPVRTVPPHWYSYSKRKWMPITSMTTEHIINSMALLQRNEGKTNLNFSYRVQLKEAFLRELAKRAPSATGITYVGPQALAVDYYS